jgi:hypothetical protein
MYTAFLIALLALASLAALVQLWRKRSIRVRHQETRIMRGLQLAVNRNSDTFQQ